MLWSVWRQHDDGWVQHDGPLTYTEAVTLMEVRRWQQGGQVFKVAPYDDMGGTLTHRPEPAEFYLKSTGVADSKRYYKIEYGFNTQRWAIRVTQDGGKTWATWLTTYKREGNARKRAQQMIDNGYGAWWPDSGREPEQTPGTPVEPGRLDKFLPPAEEPAVEWDEKTRKRLEFQKWLFEKGHVDEFSVVGGD